MPRKSPKDKAKARKALKTKCEKRGGRLTKGYVVWSKRITKDRTWMDPYEVIGRCIKDKKKKKTVHRRRK